MIMRYMVAATILVCWSDYGICEPTVTDAADSATKLLEAIGPLPRTYTDKESYRCLGMRSHGDVGQMQYSYCEKEVRKIQQVIMRPSNIRMVKQSPFVFDPPTMTEFPSELTKTGFTWANCSEKKIPSYSDTLSVTFQRSSSISISESMTNGGSVGLSFQWPVGGGAVVGGNVSISQSSTTGTTDTKSYVNSVTRQHTLGISLQPKEAFKASMETWPVRYKANFHVTATIDADVTPNDKYQKMSDAISEDQRTFQISGTVGYVDAAEAMTVASDSPFETVTCPSGAQVVKAPLSTGMDH